MQAILKNKYLGFCNWLQEVKQKQQITDHKLDEMEKEIVQTYFDYLRKLEELKIIIETYESKQKEIRQRIRLRQRKGFELEASFAHVVVIDNPKQSDPFATTTIKEFSAIMSSKSY